MADPEESVANGSSSEHFFDIFFTVRKFRGYNHLQTVRCFPFRVHNTDQRIKIWEYTLSS